MSQSRLHSSLPSTLLLGLCLLLASSSSLKLLAQAPQATAPGLAATQPSSSTWSAWERMQSLELTPTPLAYVRLTEATMEASSAHLDDLRLLDETGREIPRALLMPAPTHGGRQVEVPFEGRFIGKSLLLSFDAPASQTGPLGLSLLMSASTWSLPLSLEGSDDRSKWTPLLDHHAFVRERPSSAPAELTPSGLRFRHYRMTLHERPDSGPLQMVRSLSFLFANPEAPQASPGRVELGGIEQLDGETRVGLVFASADAWLARLRLDLAESTFQRRYRLVRRSLASDGQTIIETEEAAGLLSRFAPASTADAAVSENWLTFERRLPARDLTLIIENGPNPPLSIKAAQAEYRPWILVFPAPASGKFTLLLGNSQARDPGYDVAALVGRLGKAGMPETPASLGPVLANPAYQPAAVLPLAPLLGADLDRAAWPFVREVLVSRPGVQCLELDAAAQASAIDSDLGDLRLVKGNAQVPFVIERTQSFRLVSVPFVGAEEAPPRFSRWHLALPGPSPRVSRLRLTTTTPLLNRRVTVYSESRDRHGRTVREVHAEGRWLRGARNPADGASLELPFLTPPPAQILVDIDNGDNLPAVLSAVEVLVPVVRLHFKTAESGTLHLLSGNPLVEAPSYDLGLLAPELIASAHAEARLAPIAESSPNSRKPLLQRIGRYSGWLFWSVLTVVVCVLLVVIARLLPKPRE